MEVLFAEVNLKDASVKIPFVCQQCGECCKMLSTVVFDPTTRKIYIENLEEFSKAVNIEEIIAEIEESLDVHHPIAITCPFFKGNRCEIHPIRPKSCREFPLTEREDWGIGCPALKRLKEVIATLLDGKSGDVRYKLANIAEITKSVMSSVIADRFLSTNPSEEEKEFFFKLNEVEAKPYICP